MKGDPQLFDDEPYKQHIEPNGQRQLFDTSPYQSAPSPGVAPKNVHPGQFQMFMTPREIRSRYQALDGDRQSVEEPRSFDLTARSHTTAGETNTPLNEHQRKNLVQRGRGGENLTHRRPYNVALETDDQLFDRKLEESQLPPDEYRGVHGGETPPNEPQVKEWHELAQNSSAPSVIHRYAAGIKRAPGQGSWTANEAEDEAYNYQDEKYQEEYQAHEEKYNWGPSLHEQIASEGIQSPVHLSYEQLGSLGKPQIVGGHHRLAAQHDIDPDQPIPVKHWRSMGEARGSGKYD